MKRLIWIAPVLALLAGCEDMNMNQPQMIGTVGGAVLGAAVTPHNPVSGALIGSAVGLAAGTYLFKDSSGKCTWQRPDGTRYIANCP
jgi:hypothetical protein